MFPYFICKHVWIFLRYSHTWFRMSFTISQNMGTQNITITLPRPWNHHFKSLEYPACWLNIPKHHPWTSPSDYIVHSTSPHLPNVFSANDCPTHWYALCTLATWRWCTCRRKLGTTGESLLLVWRGVLSMGTHPLSPIVSAFFTKVTSPTQKVTSLACKHHGHRRKPVRQKTKIIKKNKFQLIPVQTICGVAWKDTCSKYQTPMATQ